MSPLPQLPPQQLANERYQQHIQHTRMPMLKFVAQPFLRRNARFIMTTPKNIIASRIKVALKLEEVKLVITLMYMASFRSDKYGDISKARAYDHTMLNIPVLVRSQKSSSIGPGQYLDGGPLGNTGCCGFLLGGRGGIYLLQYP